MEAEEAGKWLHLFWYQPSRDKLESSSAPGGRERIEVCIRLKLFLSRCKTLYHQSKHCWATSFLCVVTGCDLESNSIYCVSSWGDSGLYEGGDSGCCVSHRMSSTDSKDRLNLTLKRALMWTLGVVFIRLNHMLSRVLWAERLHCITFLWFSLTSKTAVTFTGDH